MAVLLIMAVYITVNSVLPQASSARETSGKGAFEARVKAKEVKRTVVLDAGHGGSDSGKISVTGSLEKDLNLLIVQKLKKLLEDADYEVILTRDPKVNGAQVFYYKHSAQGKVLAGCIQESFKNVLNPDNSRVEKYNDSYYMLLNTKPPTVIAECGFLSNADEAALIDTEEYRDKIAAALFQGIENYYQKGQM